MTGRGERRGCRGQGLGWRGGGGSFTSASPVVSLFSALAASRGDLGVEESSLVSTGEREVALASSALIFGMAPSEVAPRPTFLTYFPPSLREARSSLWGRSSREVVSSHAFSIRGCILCRSCRESEERSSEWEYGGGATAKRERHADTARRGPTQCQKRGGVGTSPESCDAFPARTHVQGHAAERPAGQEHGS